MPCSTILNSMSTPNRAMAVKNGTSLRDSLRQRARNAFLSRSGPQREILRQKIREGRKGQQEVASCLWSDGNKINAFHSPHVTTLLNSPAIFSSSQSTNFSSIEDIDELNTEVEDDYVKYEDLLDWEGFQSLEEFEDLYLMIEEQIRNEELDDTSTQEDYSLNCCSFLSDNQSSGIEIAEYGEADEEPFLCPICRLNNMIQEESSLVCYCGASIRLDKCTTVENLRHILARVFDLHSDYCRQVTNSDQVGRLQIQSPMHDQVSLVSFCSICGFHDIVL